jgi:hypothetical protein
MSTTIINKNTAVKNRVPGLSELTRGEQVVAHRTDSDSTDPKVVDTCIGIFIRVGRTENDDVTDQVVRIGPAVVTDETELPEAVGLGSSDDNQNWTGSLWWRKSTKEFLINTDGTREGWESVIPARQEASTAASGTVTLASLSDIYKGENEFKVVTAAGLKQYIDGVNAGTTFLVYVDPGNPNSTDAKGNRGNVPERPFKSLQRALLEVTRRSFVRNPVGVTTPNDRTERMVVYLAPAVYELYNGLGGGVDISNFGRYRDAASLILLNRDYIVNQGIAAVTLLPQSDACRRDLYYYVDGIANDIAVRGNVNTIRNAKFVRNPNGSYIAAYDSALERSQTRAALTAMEAAAILAVKNLAPLASGGVRDLSIIADPAGNPCADVQLSISTLIDILDLTLESGPSGIYPHNPLDTGVNPGVRPNPGATTASFPNTGEPTPQNLQGFNNNLSAGIILPRGVSIVGPDLRKVIFRPTYVPNADGSEGKSAIFRMTGSNFFQGFTIKDRIGQTESAHNLACFNFCTQPNLENYYDKVAVVFNDPTYFHQQQDAANLIQGNLNWITEKVRESVAFTSGTASEKLLYDKYSIDILRAFVLDLQTSSNKNILHVGGLIFAPLSELDPTDPIRVSAEGFWEDVFVALADYAKVAVRNAALPSEGGFVDPSVIADSENFSNPCINVQNTLDNFAEILTSIVLAEVPDELNIARFGIGDVEPNPAENEIVGSLSNPNTVEGASPYIFSASLRSVRGMSGIDGDGANVTGFKSYVAAQFTIVSLQTSTSAFVGTGPGSGQVASKRYKGTLANDIGTNGDYRHFGYAVRNEAYAQLVSCFCIGPAIHYHCTSGAEFSITNSTSNFGDVSLQAEGYVGQAGTGGAYLQDRGYKWLEIVRPKPLDLNNLRRVPIGNYQSRTSSSLTLSAPIQFGDLGGYTVRQGSQIYINASAIELDVNGQPQLVSKLLSARVTTTVNDASLNKQTISVSNFKVNGVTASWSTFTIAGLPVFIERVVDVRSQNDKIYKARVQAPTISRGKPLENFIFRFKYDALPGAPTYQKQLPFEQNKVAFVGLSEVVDEENRIYDLALLNGFSDLEGKATNTAAFVPNIDLDFDKVTQLFSIEDNPTDSVTFVVLNTILTELGYNQGTRETILVPDVNNYEFPTGPSDLRPDIEFNKPSIIRCGSQTWEYLGYYNYDTSLPRLQSSILGAGLSSVDAAALKLSKLQTEKTGGRIYATGLNEEGDFYIGSTRINTRTGESVDTRIEGTEDSDVRTFTKVNIVDSITMTPQSTLRMQEGANIQFQANSGITVDISTPETAQRGSRAFYSDVGGVEARRFGFARPATRFEAENEVGTDNRSNYVSPPNLAQWRAAKKLVSLREGEVPIYVGGPGARAYDTSYTSSFWPEPEQSVSALSKNPGLTFAPLRTLEDAAKWANANLEISETAVLYMTAGYYLLGGTFNCNVKIDGVANSGDVEIDTGDTTGREVGSVLFYHNLVAVTDVYDRDLPSLTTIGRRFLIGLEVTGILTIRGLGASIISNVGFVSPIQAMKALRAANSNPLTVPPIQDVLQAAINRTWVNEVDNLSYPLLPNVGFGSNLNNLQRLNRVFSEVQNVPLIIKSGGNLEIASVVFEPQSPYAIQLTGGAYLQSSHIRLENDADLVVTGSVIRGNELFIVPKTLTSSIDSTTYSIANGGAVINGSNFPVYGTADRNLEVPPASIPWINHTYNCDINGVPQDVGSYVALFGHAPAFICILSGRSNIEIRRAVYTRTAAQIGNYDSDRNNIRLECTNKSFFNTLATDNGGATLGKRGTVNLAGNVGTNRFYKELMGIEDLTAGDSDLHVTQDDFRGPLMSTFILVARSNINLTIANNYFSVRQIPGWRGAFGYIPQLLNQQLTGSSFKCTGLQLTSTGTGPIASSCIISRGLAEFWGTAGSPQSIAFINAADPTSSLTTVIREATKRNVFWRRYTPGFWPGPLFTLNEPGVVPVVNVTRQDAGSVDDDETTITNTAITAPTVQEPTVVNKAFYSANTSVTLVTSLTVSGIDFVI